MSSYNLFDSSYNLFDVTFLNSALITSSNFTNYTNIMKNAFTRWDQIITGRKNYNKPTPTYKITVTVDIRNLDINILGSATLDQFYANTGDYTYGSTLFPSEGTFIINSNRIAALSNKIKLPSEKSELYYVTLHEIGHILGIGNIWLYYVPNNPLRSYTDSSGKEQYYYAGPNALREYRNFFNNQQLVGIPIENDGDDGTIYAHLEEGTEFGVSTNDRYIDGILHPGLDQELMTGWSESFEGDMPLSRITCGLLEDIGYGVSYNLADVYNYPLTPWSDNLNCTFNKNSTNNNIVLQGNTYAPVSLSYLVYNLDFNINHGNLYDYSGNPIITQTGGYDIVVDNNILRYTPNTNYVGSDESFQYISYYTSSTGEFIYSNNATVSIHITSAPAPAPAPAPEPESISITLHNGWNLIGSSVQATIIGENISSSWTYYSNYTRLTNKVIESNKGAWIYSNIDNNVISLQMNSGNIIPTAGSTSIILHNGWNIIGTSTNCVIEGSNIGQIYQYDTNNHKYVAVTSLLANMGYLIKSNLDNNTINLQR